MIKVNFSNCFYNLTSDKRYKIPEKKFNNFYLKTKLSEIKKLNLMINSNNLTIEITKIDFNSLNDDIYRNISKHKNIKRIVLNYEILFEKDINIKNKNFQIIEEFEKFQIDNLCIDFLIGNINWSFAEKLKIFLNKFKNVKHFSLYCIDDNFSGIQIEDNFLNFRRYHLHMWAINEKMHATYDFETLKSRNYLGIGEGALSRNENNFYEFLNKKDSWTLKKINNISNEFIEFNDHINRLEFYKKITEDEWSIYKQIDKEKYEKLLKDNKNNITIVHDLLIHELILNNLEI